MHLRFAMLAMLPFVPLVVGGCDSQSNEIGAADPESTESSSGEGDDASSDASGDASSDASGGVEPLVGEIDCAELSGSEPLGSLPVGPLGFPEAWCNPRVGSEGDFRCCSDDPATLGGVLPGYAGATGAVPLFSGDNNGVGISGMCVHVAGQPDGAGLTEESASGCPTPCNPAWAEGDVETVCGGGGSCCQTRQIQPEDCVQGDDGLWRPVTGADILDERTNWAPDRHATHQDPSGSGCSVLSGGSEGEDFTDCLEALATAEQRGYCLFLAPGASCPAEEPGYMNACEQINAGLIPAPR